MAGALDAITSFRKPSEGQATGPTGALLYAVGRCTANACPRLREWELGPVSQLGSLSSQLEAVQGRNRSKVWVLCWNYSFLLRITGDLIGLSLGHSPTSVQALVPVQRNIYVAFSHHHVMENTQSPNHGLENSPTAHICTPAYFCPFSLV